MATNFTSNQYANQTQVARSGSPSRLCGMFFEGATATADTGTIKLCHLPPGKIRILSRLSGFQCDDMAADANISLGVGAYTAANGVAVVADVDALMGKAYANTKTGIANWATNMTLPANGGLEIDSLEGVDVTCTVSDANTVAANTYSGLIAFVRH